MEYKYAPENLVYITVEAELPTVQDFKQGDVAVSLDYGDYQMGTNPFRYDVESDKPLRIRRRFLVSRDSAPERLVFEVKGVSVALDFTGGLGD